MKKIIFSLLLTLYFTNLKAQSYGGIIAYIANFNDSTYSLYQQNSPTNFYGNRLEYMWVSRKQTHLYANTIYFDSSKYRSDTQILGKLMWVDNNGLINYSIIDSLKLGYNSLPFTSTTFLTKAIADGYYYPLNTNPSGYLTSITNSQVIGAIGYIPYNGTSNSLGFLTSSSLTPYQLVSNLQSNLISSSTKYPSIDAVNTGLATKQNTITVTTIGNSGNATFSGNTLNIPNYTYTPITPTFNNNVSRSISNSTGSINQYTISTTQNSRVTYTITITWSITALLATSGTIFLEYSTNSGSTWNIVASPGKSINLGLVQSGTDDLSVSGDIPANALVRLRPSNTNSSFTYVRGQEILY
jgi:hypothetical protein